MPLVKSGSDEALEANIKELIDSGHPRDQAVAIALDNQKKYAIIRKGKKQFSDLAKPDDKE